MKRIHYLTFAFTLLFAAMTAIGMRAGELKSGPQPGTLLPGSFHPYNVTGTAKGRHHCLVCEFGLRPAVMIFARSTDAEKSATLKQLLQKLDAAIASDPQNELAGFVVFLSPDAESAVTIAQAKDQKITDPSKLVEEFVKRETMLNQFQQAAGALKKVVVAVAPVEGPKGYDVNPKADVTVILYKDHRVIENFAFAPGELNDAGVERIMTRVREMAGMEAENAAKK